VRYGCGEGLWKTGKLVSHLKRSQEARILHTILFINIGHKFKIFKKKKKKLRQMKAFLKAGLGP
jgi:hypothetical protein